ncbi:menaquinone-dependent protoporphyrinogen IX dehydrogenase [Ferrimonas marina]|uniref:Protoporphyrinogen IX dehydrogenase [quinone] n=1 Tax=Ferrimonas marina TaxID=299255 RepID=A0A1M5ZHS2_9GAMM|nr:menaquinone-dependent protoporphyrinogen IX dehydrogenase [Ferrimonas marina]SHI23639.1 menaquinone-dependent protoporphyrinogen oxidase [Ferrimonas marina]
MLRVLVLYSTVDGQTRRIAERIQARLEALDHQVQLQELERCTLPLAQFDKVVIGASIRYGKYRPALFEFIRQHQATLASKPCAFFSVNLVARKAGKDTPEGSPYIRLFHKRSPWQPQLIGVFAGKLNYPIYRWRDRQVIRFIMWMTKGPTDLATVQEFTDWGRVELFADQLASLGAQ